MILLALALQAAAPAPLPAPTPAAKSRADRKICRTIQDTGSLMAKRICRTAREWSAMSNDSQDTLERTRQQTSGRFEG